MRPLEANQRLLRVRAVRPNLFLQKNIVEFYEGISRGLTSIHTTEHNNPWAGGNHGVSAAGAIAGG